MHSLKSAGFIAIFTIALFGGSLATAQEADDIVIPMGGPISHSGEEHQQMNSDYRVQNAQANPSTAAPAAAAAADPAAVAASNSEALAECGLEVSSANTACTDQKSIIGLSSSESMMMSLAVSQMAQYGAQAAAAKGSANACRLASLMGGAMQLATQLKGKGCSKAKTQCENTCNQTITQIEATPDTTPLKAKRLADANKKLLACKAQEKNLGLMAMQMMMTGQSIMSALQCKDASSSDIAAVATPPTLSLTSSIGDCSDSKFASTSPYCICKANPSDSMCPKNVSTATGSTGSGVAGGIATPGIADAASDDMAEVDTSFKGGTGSGAGTVKGDGGGSGGGSGGGGSGGGLAGGEEGGAAGSGIDKNVITGASSSGGGIPGGGLGMTGGGGGAGGAKAGAGGAAKDGGFNLAKYLPKNMFKNRGLAGMSVPSTDGVTGPLGPSIWEKVHNRYEEKKSTLILDK